jgi:DNA-binding sugar fermentation-stimulating protein
MKMMILHNLLDLEEVKIISRPSKICKTPYVADIQLKNGSIVQAHSASLGCCGLCEKDCIVLASPILSNSENSKSKVCSYKIYLVSIYEEKIINESKFINNQIIGIDPKLAETLVNNAILNNCFEKLQNVKKLRREIKLGNSRFDFGGIDNNNKYFVLEVNNVPLADYVDCDNKSRKKMNFDNIEPLNKISYFPDGYRKAKNQLVSERALNHINELEFITNSNIIRPIICFVIQRTDSSSFQASDLDPIYKEAFNEALKKGVEVFTLVVRWDINGNANFEHSNLFINY